MALLVSKKPRGVFGMSLGESMISSQGWRVDICRVLTSGSCILEFSCQVGNLHVDWNESCFRLLSGRTALKLAQAKEQKP